MVGRHHRLNGHESAQTPGDGEGQGSLVCCSSWECKESDMPDGLNISFFQNGTGNQTGHILPCLLPQTAFNLYLSLWRECLI